jgi:hypothetical protein
LNAPSPTWSVESIERRAERGFGVFAVAYALAVWWPTRWLPYHWDSAMFVIDAGRELLASHFQPLIATHSDFAHPPLFVALLAVVWRVFGESRLVSHAFVAPALPLAMMATYRLGRDAGDVALGAAAGALFGGVAVVVAEYGQIYMDLPVAALLAWAIASWMERRYALASALMCISALMKIPAPLTMPAALAALLAADRAQRRDPRAWAALAMPFVAVAGWLAYHRAVTGWWLARPGRTVTSPRDAAELGRGFVTVGVMLLMRRWRWLLLAAALSALAWARVQRKGWIDLRPIRPHLAVLGAGWVLFAAVGEFGTRYGIYLLPSYFVAMLYVVRRAGLQGTPWALGVAAVFALFVTTWHPRQPLTTAYTFSPDDDLGYLDMISIGQRSARWLAEKHSDAEIYGTVPESYQLTEPWQGYVETPLRFAFCRAFQRQSKTTQILYVHAYHPGQLQCRRIVEALSAKVIKHFEANGKWLELYRVPKEEDATSGGGP